MADVGHELGSLKFVVDKPLSSKVAMFNQQVSSHNEKQLMNPFSNVDGRRSPKPTFSKDEYGKPLAGSLTEMRGQKANIHVLKEMLELCQIIHTEGHPVSDEPTMRVIPFGELFNIYNYISDKVVGICLRSRKHKLIDFEGEMLFQRRDDDVPIFLLKPIAEIKKILQDKQEEIKRGASPAPPQSTSVLMDQQQQKERLKQRSASPAPPKSKSAAPVKEKPKEVAKPLTEEIKTDSIPAAITETSTPAPEPTQPAAGVQGDKKEDVQPETAKAVASCTEVIEIIIEAPSENTTTTTEVPTADPEQSSPSPAAVEIESSPSVDPATVPEVLPATDKVSDENNNTDTTAEPIPAAVQ